MDTNISWKDVFISFFIKDLVYPVLLATGLLLEFFLFKRLYNIGLRYNDIVDIVGSVSSFIVEPIVMFILFKFMKKLRAKEEKAIDDFLTKKFEYKTPNPSAWDQVSYTTRIMFLYIGRFIYLGWIFYELYGYYLLNQPF
jgi:hypothetical protein